MLCERKYDLDTLIYLSAHIRRLILLLIFILSAAHCYAGLDSSSFHHFNLKNGLPSDNVYCTLQDRDGYLWLATDNGLVRYNGYSFQLFNTETAKLPSNDVFDIYEDNRGRIWLRTFSNRIGYIKDGVFKNISYSVNDRMIAIADICEYRGLLYFLVWRTGSFDMVIVADDVIKVIKIDADKLLKTEGESFYNVSAADNLSFHIWTTQDHLYLLDLEHPQPKYLGKIPESYKNRYNRKASRNAVFDYSFQPRNHEIEVLNLVTLKHRKYSLEELGGSNKERLFAMNPYFFRKGQQATSLISNSHLYLFNRNFKLVSRNKFSDIIPSNTQVAFRHQVNGMDTWFSTNGDGIWVKPGAYGFYADGSDIPTKSRYAGSVKNSSFWIVPGTAELSELEKGKKINTIKLDDNVEVRHVTGNDSFVFISSSAGIWIYDRKSKIVKNLSSTFSVEYSQWFYDHYHNNESVKTSLQNVHKMKIIDSTLYCFAAYGLLSINLNNETAVVSFIDPERYFDFFYDEAKRKLYMYSNKRILVKDISANATKIFDTHFLDRVGITNVRKLVTDKYGDSYILDNASLNRYDSGDISLQEIQTDFSLADATLYINGDELYIAGPSGIATAYISGKGQLINFTIVPNMNMGHYSRIMQMVIHEDGHGILQTDAGVINFNTHSLKEFGVQGKNAFSMAMLQPYKHKIRNYDSLKFGQEETVLKLDAINYNGKGNVTYTYRISGNTRWERSTSGEVFLSGLSAGVYYKIECKLNDDLWKSGTYTFYLYRCPKWWQTQIWKTVFWILGVLSFITLVLIVMAITRYYVAKKNERKRALTELELQAIHSQINPHFIFNTLSAALYYINKKRFDDAYVHVNKFSQLLRAYLKSSQDRYVTLEEEIKMLRNYIELQQIRFEEKFEYEVVVDNKLPAANIRIPSLLLQPLVENAINHGLFHQEKGGNLLLKFEQGRDNSELICTIEDNGVGRERAKKINESNSHKESYGTKLTNQLLEVFQLYENLDIDLKYFDKEPPETGTTVVLTLKNINYVA